MKRFHIILVKRTTLIYIIICVLFCCSVPFAAKILSEGRVKKVSTEDHNVEQKKVPKLSIIIDDFGSSRDGVNEMMNIPCHLTFAVMPFMENSQVDAEEGYRRGYEIIAHLSMEPEKGKKSWLGPKPIMTAMSSEDITSTVIAAFESVPYASGANNHMGSKASGDEKVMSAVLDVIKSKRLYFVNSRTSNSAIAKQICISSGVDYFERNVFLDGQRSVIYVKQQLKKASDIALKYGKAIAIGHVGFEGGVSTAQAIEEMLPFFEEKGIELTFVSEL